MGEAGVPQVGKPQGAVRSRHRDHHPLRRREDVTADHGADQLVGRSDQPRRRGATAFGHRTTKVTIYIFAMWDDPTDSDRHIAWSRAFHDTLRPYMNGIYVNEMGPDERIHDAYPPATLARLVEIKTK